jgi:hypothetical protein
MNDPDLAKDEMEVPLPNPAPTLADGRTIPEGNGMTASASRIDGPGERNTDLHSLTKKKALWFT